MGMQWVCGIVCKFVCFVQVSFYKFCFTSFVLQVLFCKFRFASFVLQVSFDKFCFVSFVLLGGLPALLHWEGLHSCNLAPV